MTIEAFRKQRFNENTLVIGIDVAKNLHVAAADTAGVARTPKPLPFKNTRSGFESLETWMQQLQARSGATRLVVALEPTGHYGKPLVEWLTSKGHEVRLASPLHTKRAKELLDGSPRKTDAKDAAVIADLARDGKTRPWVVLSEPFQALRYLVTLRHRLVEQRAAGFNQLHRVMDLLFPELLSLFRDFRSKTLRALLRLAPTPRNIVALGSERIAELFKHCGRGRVASSKALAVHEAARTSVGVQSGHSALCFELGMLLDQVDALDTQISQVEAQMAASLREVEYAEHLLAIPEVGAVTAAILCGELGDLKNYAHPEQVLKMAGLSLHEQSSGQLKGRDHLTKRGRPRLRQAIHLVVLRMVKQGKALHAWFSAHKEKKAGASLLVVAARKLLRAIFVSVKKEVPFQLERFVPRVPGTTVTSLAA